MKLDPRIPEPVQPIIKDSLRLTEQRFAGLSDASYVVGSIALGEFNEHFSDIDFVAVPSRKATPIDLGHLSAIHQSIGSLRQQWQPLIQEAISIRQTKQATSYRSRFGRMIETVGFLNYVIDLCNGDLVS